MTETPTQRADRVDRMLEHCRERNRVSLAQLASVRNDLRDVATQYEDLEAQLKLQAGAVPLDPFGEWLDHQMRELDLGAADIAAQSNRLLNVRDIMQWRAGRGAPNASEAFILANAIGVRVLDALNYAGHGHMVVAIVEENDELRAANQPAIRNGQAVPEFPGHPGSRWCDVAGDEWVLGDDGRMYVAGCILDPNDVAESYGPLTRAGDR